MLAKATRWIEIVAVVGKSAAFIWRRNFVGSAVDGALIEGSAQEWFRLDVFLVCR